MARSDHHDHDHDHGAPEQGSHDHGAHDHGAHDHAHAIGHEGHSHAPDVTAGNEARLRLVLGLTAGYALVQAVGGLWAGSLALIADAGHMVSDAAALALALIAYRVARRAADATRTYGFHRVRVLAALGNGAALLLLVIWIAFEAVGRLRAPSEVLAGGMLAVAVIGLAVNLVGLRLLGGGHHDDANLRGAWLHVMGDMLGSVGAIVAALGIMATGWLWLDPVLSLLVAGLVLRSAWGLVSDAIRVLLQATPPGVSADGVAAGIAALPEIAEAGHFHAWTLTDSRAIATVHVTPAPGADPLALPPLVAAYLRERHRIDHVTVQVDPPGSIPPVRC